MNKIKDSERTCLRVSWENGDVQYYNSGHYMLVSDPSRATRYAPLDDDHPTRKEGRDSDAEYVQSQVVGKIDFIIF